MGKKAKKQETISVYDLLGGGLTYIYLALMMGVFPIYYPGTLIGLQAVKSGFFIIVTTVYGCLMAIFFLIRAAVAFREHRKIKVDASDVLMAVFAGAILISTLLAPDRTKAFFGDSSIRTGATVMLLCVLVYYAVKMYAKFDKFILWANLLASTLINISGILITCRTDILKMQEGIIEAQTPIFVSPLGNIDYNVSYISLILPAAMALFLMVQKLFTKRTLVIYLYISFMNIICLRTQSSVILTIFSFVLLLYFALEHSNWLSRYFMALQIFIAANVTVYFLRSVVKVPMFAFDGLNAFLLKPEVIVFEIAVFAVLFWLKKAAGKLSDEKVRKLQKLYGIAFLVIIAVSALFLVALNVLWKDAASRTILSRLILNDDTFSCRGYVWIRSVELFLQQSFVGKLFGCGLANFYNIIYPLYGADMIEKFNSVFYDPHNDFLWVLMTTGVVGAIGFFGSIFSTIRASVRKKKNQKLQIMAVMSLAGFLLQGLVNSYTIFAIPILFIVLGLAHSSLSKSELESE